jgi:hypothetical protein
MWKWEGRRVGGIGERMVIYGIDGSIVLKVVGMGVVEVIGED